MSAAPTLLVAEDEPLMRERLLDMLGAIWPEARVVLVAENGNDAWDGFLEHEPDVAILDIRMPGLSGLEVAERIGTRAHVVFVTAYDQYAVDAFDAGAADYLLKPVQADRLATAVARLRARIDAAPADLGDLLRQLRTALPAPRRERIKWLKAGVGRQVKVIDVDEVLFFQSDTKYTRVVLPGCEALLRTPLKDLLAGLDGERFWQVHRGTVVNAAAIACAERVDAERMELVLRGCDERVLVSRSFTHLFKE